MADWMKPCSGYLPSEDANRESYDSYADLLGRIFACDRPQITFDDEFEWSDLGDGKEDFILLEGCNGEYLFLLSKDTRSYKDLYDLLGLYSTMGSHLKLSLLKKTASSKEQIISIARCYGNAIVELLTGHSQNIDYGLNSSTVDAIYDEMRKVLPNSLKESDFNPVKAGIIRSN